MKGAHFKKDKEPERTESRHTFGEALFGNDSKEPETSVTSEAPDGSVAPVEPAPILEPAANRYTENTQFDPMLKEVLHDLGLDEEEIRAAMERAKQPQTPAQPPLQPPPAFIPTASLEASIAQLEAELEAAGEPLIPATRDSEELLEKVSADVTAEPEAVQNEAEEVAPESANALETNEEAPQESSEPQPEEATSRETPAAPETEEENPGKEESVLKQAETEIKEITEESVQESDPIPEAETAEEKAAQEPDEPKAEEGDEEGKPEKKRKKGIRILFDWLEEIIFAVVIVVVVFSFLFRVVTVQGTSMETTFSGGDKLIVSSFIYPIKQGDVIVAVDVLEDPIIKRVIATEGQTVDIDNETGSVYVDGVKLDESAYTENGITYVRGGGRLQFPAVVPENCVFVLGDNRVVSKDSRFEDVGMISLDHILGKAELQVFPFSEIHLLR